MNRWKQLVKAAVVTAAVLAVAAVSVAFGVAELRLARAVREG